MTTIQEFAEKYNVRIHRDSCSDDIIPGFQFCKDMPKRREYRTHIFDGFDNGHLGLCLLFTSKRKYTFAKKQLLDAGFELRQDGDTEGVLTFDPANESQSQLALDTAHVRTIRKASPAVLANLANARTAQTAA